jgi:hypothetical protein
MLGHIRVVWQASITRSGKPACVRDMYERLAMKTYRARWTVIVDGDGAIP